MTVQVATIGIDLPDDFPHQPYDHIHARVHAAPRHADQTFHYGGAWNGVVYQQFPERQLRASQLR